MDRNIFPLGPVSPGAPGKTPQKGGGSSGLPRGLRNNNPGNIEKGANWRGLSSQQTDSRFAQFISPQWGIRAMAIILRNYTVLHGINTIAGIVERWAPGHENPTVTYADFVAERVGVNPNAEIDVVAALPRIIPAMIEFENGVQPYGPGVIQEALELAGFA